MAQLTAADYKRLRKLLYSITNAKPDLKALPNLPSETQLMAAFQFLEDDWTGRQAALKAGVDAALARTTTNALARKIGETWMMFKIGL